MSQAKVSKGMPCVMMSYKYSKLIYGKYLGECQCGVVELLNGDKQLVPIDFIFPLNAARVIQRVINKKQQAKQLTFNF